MIFGWYFGRNLKILPGISDKSCIFAKNLAKSGCTSAIEIHFIALTVVDLGRDSAIPKQAWMALAAPSVRFALTLQP
jgi:hypothetical protein